MLHEAAANIWNSMLELEIERDDGLPLFPPDGERLLAGRVTVAGRWRGCVLLVCPKAVARKAAAVMFERPPPDLTDTELRDTVGELAHMLGGNLKSLLPAPSLVSLPVVTEHYNIAVAGRLAGRVLLRCEDHILQISLFEQE